MKNSAAGLLTSLDDLFSTQEEREAAAQPRVEDIPIDQIDDFPNHPFKVRMDGAMVRLVESVGQYGVLEPCLKLADVLNNIPQKQLAHYPLTASATVDGNAVNMLEDDGSVNAHAPLSVVNTRGFDLPETGDNGTMMFTVFGILIMAGAAAVIVLASRKKRNVH